MVFWWLWLNPWYNGSVIFYCLWSNSLVQWFHENALTLWLNPWCNGRCSGFFESYKHCCWFNTQINCWLWTLWFSNSYFIFGQNLLVMYVMAFDECMNNPFDIWYTKFWIVMWMIRITKALSIVHVKMNFCMVAIHSTTLARIGIKCLPCISGYLCLFWENCQN